MASAVKSVASVSSEQAAVMSAEAEATSLGKVRGQPGFRSARLYRGEDETGSVPTL